MNPTQHPFLTPMRRLISLCLLALLAGAGRAQQLEDTVFTLGTVTQDKSLRHWGFLLMQPTRPDLLYQRKLAIYRKAGDAGSSAAYERRAILTMTTDPSLIGALLQRAVNLGDDTNALSARIDNLFAAIVPAGNLSLADKLGAVIRGSLDQPQHYNNLIQLGRLHPAVNLCLGLAHAEAFEAAGIYTFEVRDFDLLGNADRSVLGRVTVETGKPTVLPAPGGPFEVRDPSGKGHLNVKLRWATSPDFRRLSLLSYGFNVYRVNREFAEAPANKFQVNPPAAGALGLLASVSPHVELVNHVPVLTSRNLDDSPAADPDSVYNPTNRVGFLADDHGLASGGVPFKDGESFYYFVAGRDILGRDGLTSVGTLVTICDRVPPDSPRLPKVENHYGYDGSAKQHLKVTWKPVAATDGDAKIVGYHVYRWKAPADIGRFENNPAINRINGALIPHIPGQTSYTFIDDGAGSPTVPADQNKTFWYSVRAVDAASCDGGNLSANSPAAFGVLREFVGPVAPVGGGVKVLCCEPILGRLKTQDERDTALDQDRFTYDLTCVRQDDGIAWAEFWIGYGGASNYVGRVTFQPGQTNVVRRYSNVRDVFNGLPISLEVTCRVGMDSGRVSDTQTIGVGGLPPGSTLRTVSFQAASRCERVTLFDRPVTDVAGGNAGLPDDCRSHSQPPKPVGSPDAPEWAGPVVVFPLTPTTREFRLYRRVDFGPLSLIKQGQAKYDSVTNLAVEIPDNDLPASSGILCYYGQLFDEHGNPSPLTQLGACTPNVKESPKPMLAALEPQGSDAAPMMRVRWFCPPSGVERFELWVGTVGNPPVKTLVAELSDNQSVSPNTASINPGDPPAEQIFPDFGTYLTPQPGLNFGSGAAFDVTVPIKSGRRYYVRVKVVLKGGADGKFSNVESLFWKAPPGEVGPQVPWPARPLPDVTEIGGFNTNIVAAQLRTDSFDGLAVSIGFAIGNIGDVVRLKTVRDKTGSHVVYAGSVNPESYVFQNLAGETLLPVALYRYQVPSPAFPVASGDVVQVSPLMENLAFATETDANLGTYTRIYDPFVSLEAPTAAGAGAAFAVLYLHDTQPVVYGAKYAYLLVRFTKLGEILEVIPTAPVEVMP